MEWLRLRWVKDTRYYEAYLHPDLWGQWVVTQVWGRQGSKLGRVRHTPCASYAEALGRLAAVGARRRQRGYVRVAEAPASVGDDPRDAGPHPDAGRPLDR